MDPSLLLDVWQVRAIVFAVAGGESVAIVGKVGLRLRRR